VEWLALPQVHAPAGGRENKTSFSPIIVRESMP